MGRTLFITGTDTEAGKTLVAAALARLLTRRGKRVGVWKPVASGCEEREGRRVSDDAVWLARGARRDDDPSALITVALREPLSPHMAARLEASRLDTAALFPMLREDHDRLAESCDILIAEGVGGFLVPLADRWTVADMASAFGWPVLLVAADRLGCINHTLLTLEAIEKRRLETAGVILSRTAPGDYASRTNREALALATDAPILADLPYYETDDSEVLIERAADALEAEGVEEALAPWMS